MKSYKALNTSIFKNQNYEIIPLRFEDRMDIMKWRNEQIYHLRQNSPLTEKDQDDYFRNVVNNLFDQEKPSQILFSFLKNGELIGYGGLVHINWVDKHAEISFIMKTELEKDYFAKHWSGFLDLLERVAFNELNFHKVFVYAFDLRPYLYTMLELNLFYQDARLTEHCLVDGEFRDVVIYSKLSK